MGRGNRHGVIYRDRDDYGLFLRLLKEVQNRYPFVLQAYCLMTNHFHLELTTVNAPIWESGALTAHHYIFINVVICVDEIYVVVYALNMENAT